MNNLSDIEKMLNTLDNPNETTVNSMLSYKKILEDNDIILDTENIVEIFNDTINKSILTDENIQNQLNNIDNIRTSINNKFIYKNKLCEEYVKNYDETKNDNNNLYKMYNTNLEQIINKNNEYNDMINDLLEQYKTKYNEYKQNVKELYPKNYVIQIIVNMIVLNDVRNKTNIMFKNMIKEELTKQTNELNEQNKLKNNLNLNTMIMGECENMGELISNIEKKSVINLKEQLVENLINEL